MAAASTATPFLSIKHGACTDSYHDFGHGGKGFNTSTTADANKPGLAEVKVGLPTGTAVEATKPVSRGAGIPITVDTLRDEPTMLCELFQRVSINNTRVVPGARENAGLSAPASFNIIQQILDLMQGQLYADANITLPTIDGDRGYTLKVLHKEVADTKIGNIKQIGCKLNTNDFYSFFGTENINLLFDASVVNVTALIKNCKLATGEKEVKSLNLKRIINRELINDPAPKTYEEPATPAKSPVNFEIMFETQGSDITYGRYTGSLVKQNDQQRDKFFSLFDFRMGPLINEPKKLPKISASYAEPRAFIPPTWRRYAP